MTLTLSVDFIPVLPSQPLAGGTIGGVVTDPSGRAVANVFGSGGPRAFQFAARFSF